MTTEIYKGYKIVSQIDEDPINPRQYDNIGTMYLFHRSMNLGDTHSLTLDEVKALETNKDYVWLPVYAYQHGGITIRTTPYQCRFDSGQLGIIAASKDGIRKDLFCKYVTKKVKEQVYELLRGEVSDYDKYLNCSTYEYIIYDADGDIITGESDYETEEGALRAAKLNVDSHRPEQLALNFNNNGE